MHGDLIKCDCCKRKAPVDCPEVSFWYKTHDDQLICVGCAINNFQEVYDQVLQNVPTIEEGTQIH